MYIWQRDEMRRLSMMSLSFHPTVKYGQVLAMIEAPAKTIRQKYWTVSL